MKNRRQEISGKDTCLIYISQTNTCNMWYRKYHWLVCETHTRLQFSYQNLNPPRSLHAIEVSCALNCSGKRQKKNMKERMFACRNHCWSSGAGLWLFFMNFSLPCIQRCQYDFWASLTAYWFGFPLRNPSDFASSPVRHFAVILTLPCPLIGCRLCIFQTKRIRKYGRYLAF